MVESRTMWALALVFALWCGAALRAACQRAWRAREGRRHLTRGLLAERDAERLLEHRGFRIQARQARAGYRLWVDGEEQAVEVCADLLVHDGRRPWVAEVKTGQRGRRVGYRGTRRQLLEYQLAFEVQGVLLVDPERGQVDRVQFPFGRQRPAHRRSWLRGPLWLLAGAAATAGWLLATRH